jgi:hypothetical protein
LSYFGEANALLWRGVLTETKHDFGEAKADLYLHSLLNESQ